jgi:hypothetical protein
MKNWIIILVLAFLFCGCATPSSGPSGPSPVDIITSRIDQLQIGMSPAEVKSIVGQPRATKTTVVAGGSEEAWGYDLNTLSVNLLSSGQQFAMGFQSGMYNYSITKPRLVVTFTNGTVSRIEK